MTAPSDDWLKQDKLLNWAECYEYGVKSPNVHQPQNVEEVQELVRKVDKIRALGTRHSFQGIADSKHNILWTHNLDQIYPLDKQAKTVTIGAGITYGHLAIYLYGNKFALHNMASLPHISIAGAVSTATHGSGVKNGCLSTAVLAIEFVKADGEIVTLKRGRDADFEGAVVALGGLGIVTKLTLKLLPTFTMKQEVYMDLPMDALKDHFLEIMSSEYSVSFFTTWQNRNINQVWVKSVVNQENQNYPKLDLKKFGAKFADADVRPPWETVEKTDRINLSPDDPPIIDLPGDQVTEQKGAPGPWHERMPHVKFDCILSHTVELQSEYFVPIEHSYDAIMAVESLHEQITPLLFISEVRTINADDLWMSPFYKQKCTAIHFTWKQDMKGVSALLPKIEAKLKPFKVRPHWAKLFIFSHEYLASIYEKLPDFQKLLKKYDPHGKFRNDFLDTHIFGGYKSKL